MLGKFCWIRLFVKVMFLLSLTATMLAQVSTVGGRLQGVVTDSARAVVVGASVNLRNVETGQTRLATTSGEGEFLASELPPGTYEVSVSRTGFATFRHTGIVLLMGRSVQMDVVLHPATVQGQVTVSSQPDALEPTQTAVVTNVETEQIEELPVQSRNYLNFVLLAPGVVGSQKAQPTSGGQPALGLADSGFSFGGLRGRSNSISIDGVENNDEFSGANRTELSLELVREFQVVNSGISAESGGASGGAINVITKGGGNVIHGDAFLFVQNAATNARDPLSDAGLHPDFNRYRAGLAIGGPFHRDRTFYYVAAEQEHTRAQELAEIDKESLQAINATLASGPYPGFGIRALGTGLFETARAETEVSGKVDHQLSNAETLMLRYSFTNNREAGSAFNTNNLVDVSAGGSSFTKDHAFVGALNSVVSSQFLNDLRFQAATRTVILRTNDQNGPGFEIAGIASFGRPYGGNGERRENHYQIVDTVSLSRSSHLLKFGAAISRVSLNVSDLSGFGGQYLFSTVADFVAGRPQMWIQACGQPRTDFATTSYGAFVQDHWTPRWAKRFTLDAGMRYDFEQIPQNFSRDYNNVSPRVALAYNPADKWMVRAAYGIYFDRHVLAFLNRAQQIDGRRAFLQVAEGGQAAAALQASGGGLLNSRVALVMPSIYRADPQFATPYSQQVSAGMERLITPNTTISATYQFVRGIELPRTVNVNLPPPVMLNMQNAASLGVANPSPQQLGRPVFGTARIDSAFDNVYQLQDGASSTYHGLSLAVNHRLANEVAFSSSYTWAKALDDASDFDEQPQNPYDLRAERSVSRNDRRHRFVFSGLFDLPFGDEEDQKPGSKEGNRLLDAVLGHIELAPIFTASSAVAVNPVVGIDANQSEAFPISSRPLGYPRNSLRLPAMVNLDVRLVKYVRVKPHGRLDFVVETFNVFNRRNLAAANNVFGSGLIPRADFGRPIESLRPRQIQFSIDFEF